MSSQLSIHSQIPNSGDNLIKLFTALVYKFSEQARVFVLGKPIQPNLMFEVEARSLSYSEAPEWYFIRVGSSSSL